VLSTAFSFPQSLKAFRLERFVILNHRYLQINSPIEKIHPSNTLLDAHFSPNQRLVATSCILAFHHHVFHNEEPLRLLSNPAIPVYLDSALDPINRAFGSLPV